MSLDVVDNVLVLEDVRPLLEAAESSGTIRSVKLYELVEPHQLAPLELESLRRELESRGFELVEERAEKPGKPKPAPPPPQPVATPLESTTDALQLFLREAGRHALLQAAQEVELAKKIERGDPEAKQRMIQANLRLVVSIAKNYRRTRASRSSISSRRARSA